MGSFRTILRFILKLRTHTSRAGGRGMGDTLRESRLKTQRRRSIHQARSSTLEVRGAGRAQRRPTPQRGPYRRGSAATSALPSADYSLLRTCPVRPLTRSWQLIARQAQGLLPGSRPLVQNFSKPGGDSGDAVAKMMCYSGGYAVVQRLLLSGIHAGVASSHWLLHFPFDSG